MSATINLRDIHTRVACVQAECALWQIRREWEHLLATTTDEARRVQIAELLRRGYCPPDEVIRGAHGYFAGCASKGPQNTEFHRQHDWAKEVGGQKYAGLKHEAEAHYQRNVKGNEEKAKAAEDKAAKAAAKLTPAQRQELQDLGDRLDKETIRLGEQLKSAAKGSAEWKALTKEIGLRGTEARLVAGHLARAGKAAQETASKPAKAPSGRTKAPSPAKASARGASERTSLDELHATARALRATEGLPDEVKAEDLAKNRQGTPIIPVKEKTGDLQNVSLKDLPKDLFAKVDPHELAKLYGEEHLGVALSQLTHQTLRGVAKEEGIEPGNMSKAELVSRLTSKATNGRYSADFDSKKTASTTKSAGTSRPRESSRQGRAKFQPIGEASTTKVNDLFGNVNISEYHRIYGTLQLPRVLSEFTPTTLRSVARQWAENHPQDGEPRLASKKDMIDYLVKGAVREQGHIGPKTPDQLDQFLADRKTKK